MSIHWSGLANVLIVGLIAGVGLVALFAYGVRLLAQASAGVASGPGAGARRAIAYVCFAVCVGVAVYGLTLLLRK
jgi:hypothetical protein